MESQGIGFWEESEEELQKWKILDYVCLPVEWATRSTIARILSSQRVIDHWPVVTIIAVPEVKERWRCTNGLFLKRLTPASLSDEVGFAISIMSKLDDTEDAVGEVSIEVITKSILEAARSVNFERRGVRSQPVKKTKEDIES